MSTKSKALGPPPKMMSGLTSPAPSSGAGSRTASRYTTPGATTAASTTATTTPARATSASASVSYETFAPRTAEQRARLARLAQLTAGPCFPSGGDDHYEPAAAFTLTDALCPPKAAAASSGSAGRPDDDLSAADRAIAATLATAALQTSHLTTLIKHTASLRLALSASLNIGADVSRRHADLLRHSGELSAAAERLQSEEQRLTRRAEEIGRPLQHYDAVDRLGPLVGVVFKNGGRAVVRGNGRLHVDNAEEFVEVLERVDAAVEFFGGSGGGAAVFGRPGGHRDGRRGREKLAKEQAFDAGASGAAEYYRRACALQDAAIELLRVGVADRISQTAAQVQDALGLPAKPLAADKLEASLVYTRFHGIARRSRGLAHLARRRRDALGPDSVAAASYDDALALCRRTYCGAREALLAGTVKRHMDALRERHGLVGMTRLASVFLIRLCMVETALYLDFFGDPEARGGAPRKAGGRGAAADDGGEGDEGDEGDGLGEDADGVTPRSPYRRASSTSSQPRALAEDPALRDPEFQAALARLCAHLHRTLRRGLVAVLDLDVLCQVVAVLREERAAAGAGPVTRAAAHAVGGAVQDAQERLIFCANQALHREVARFRPSPGDLNYPGKLLGEEVKASIVIEDEDDGGGAEKEEGEEEARGTAEEEGKDAPPDAVAAQLRVYESWFPPMRSVLRILSKIFRVVEPRVFEDIALQSVQSCTKSLKDGSLHVLRKSGQIHSDLFLVKHLLILREQLSPFDIQLRSVERQLDFSEAGRAVTRFLANRNRRLFSMSTENALVTLLREGVSVQEASVDSKRDLEDCLRSACNDFIEHTSGALLGPIAGFVDRCKSASTGAAAASPAALWAAPFMNGAVVRGVFDSALRDLDGELENVWKQMNLYLENTATQGILLKPVLRKMARTLEEAKRFIGEVPGEDNGWDAKARVEVLRLVEEYESKVKAASSKK